VMAGAGLVKALDRALNPIISSHYGTPNRS
jgi:hypothetical protein